MSGKGKSITYYIDKNGCFINNSHSKDLHGYPHIWRNGKGYNMHIFIYIEAFGKIDKGLVVRHKCDNKKCINLNHLELGTSKDNSNDCKIRGRLNTPRGEIRKDCKITDKEVIEIINSKEYQYKIAKKYNISQSEVSRIKSKKKRRYINEK